MSMASSMQSLPAESEFAKKCVCAAGGPADGRLAFKLRTVPNMAVRPAVHRDRRNVPVGIKTVRAKHQRQLEKNLLFLFARHKWEHGLKSLANPGSGQRITKNTCFGCEPETKLGIPIKNEKSIISGYRIHCALSGRQRGGEKLE